MSAGVIFKGAMPAFYDRYLGPITFTPYAAEMVARVERAAPARLLETACGTGVLTYALRDALPADVSIVATDISAEMVAFAAAKRPARIEWKQADALALPFPDAAFDTLVCQFGVMFFPDKAKGFREARRVLKTGGTFLFSVWDRIEANELPYVSTQTLARLFPDDPPSFMQRVPYGYHDVAAIERDLRAAGFARVAAEHVEKRLSPPSARDYALGSCQGSPLRGEIEARDPNGLERATEAVTRALEAKFGTGPFHAASRALFVTASG
jgi:SAM-dependent methyltransferase